MRAANDIGHFAIVFVLILVNYACVGHFLYAFSYPDDFGSLFSSVIAMIKMITGQIEYSDLTDAYGSTSVPFNSLSYLPVQMFYFGFFFIVVMILLNICECVSVSRVSRRWCATAHVLRFSSDPFFLAIRPQSSVSSSRRTITCTQPLSKSLTRQLKSTIYLSIWPSSSNRVSVFAVLATMVKRSHRQDAKSR